MSVNNIANTSRLLGINRRTIEEWITLGLPVEAGGVGNEKLIDANKAMKWYAKRQIKQKMGDSDAVDINEAKRRKLVGEASLTELELMQKNGEVIEVEEVLKNIRDKILSCKAKLLNVPARSAPRVVGETSEHRISEIMTGEIKLCLEELNEPYV